MTRAGGIILRLGGKNGARTQKTYKARLGCAMVAFYRMRLAHALNIQLTSNPIFLEEESAPTAWNDYLILHLIIVISFTFVPAHLVFVTIVSVFAHSKTSSALLPNMPSLSL